MTLFHADWGDRVELPSSLAPALVVGVADDALFLPAHATLSTHRVRLTECSQTRWTVRCWGCSKQSHLRSQRVHEAGW